MTGCIKSNSPSRGIIGGDFEPHAELPRGDSAIILLRFIEWLGVDTNAEASGVLFADAYDMTYEQLHAFRVLYSLEIFRGNGNADMQPMRTVSRAELAALLFRVSSYMPEIG